MDCNGIIFDFVKKCPRRAEKLFSWTLFYSKVVHESIKIVFRGHFLLCFMSTKNKKRVELGSGSCNY